MLAPLLPLLLACTAPPNAVPPQIDRLSGVRAPLSASCDAQDALRCLLPWPSNAFTVPDASSATGLRLALAPEALPIDDDPSFLNLAEGFSRITGLAAGFEAALDESSLDGALLLLEAQPGRQGYGQAVPLLTEQLTQGELTPETLLIGRPLAPLAANADHVAVVLDSLRDAEGAALPVQRLTRVALELEAPADPSEEALRAYHAPTRSLLEQAGIEPGGVLRVWDFTTRSQEDPWRRTQALFEAMGQVEEWSAVVDTAELRDDPVALRVSGRIEDVPLFTDEEGWLVLDEDGLPLQQGSHEVSFRVFVPVGTGDYPVAFYGHGTGGGVTDGSFDDELASAGYAKANLAWTGWNEDELLDTLTSLSRFFEGSSRSTAGLLQSLADGMALSLALEGSLEEALAADSLAGLDNPAAGRRPNLSAPLWTGRSMGGTLGVVFATAHPSVQAGALNVPGAGWSHLIPRSWLYEYGVEAVMATTYDDELDQALALIAGQLAWDDVDGAVWADLALDQGMAFLLQESIGDPILPNLGSEILAASLGAVQLDPCIEDIAGLDHSSEPVVAASAIEQFHVASEEMFDIHDFIDDDTLAAQAAREQLTMLAESARAGSPQLAHPEICLEQGWDGSCDFGE